MRIQTPTMKLQHWWLLAAGILRTHKAQNALLEQVVNLELVEMTILMPTSPCKGQSMKLAALGMSMGCQSAEKFGFGSSGLYVFALLK